MSILQDANDIAARLEAGEIREVLAVRASRLGDLLMTTPALRAFRESFPSTRLTVLTNPYSADLLRGNPDIDEVLLFGGRERALSERAGRRLAESIRGRFDLLLALRPRRTLSDFARAAGIPALFPGGDQGEDRSVHVVQQGFDRLAALGLRGQPGPLRLHLDESACDAKLSTYDLPERFVHLHPGCDETYRWRIRRGVRRRIWPTERWIELIEALHLELDLPCVLTSGSDVEGHWTKSIASACSQTEAHPRLVHRPGLRELARISQRAIACVTVDTGPLHIACAVGSHLVGLYGPSPRAYTGPWDPSGRATVLSRALPCMPCQGKSVHCPRNVCMEEISARDVLEQVKAAFLEG